jgi:hypothetical protein
MHLYVAHLRRFRDLCGYDRHPATQWTVHTDSLVLTLTIIIAVAFPFVELTGVVMALDWRGGRQLRDRTTVPPPS